MSAEPYEDIEEPQHLLLADLEATLQDIAREERLINGSQGYPPTVQTDDDKIAFWYRQALCNEGPGGTKEGARRYRQLAEAFEYAEALRRHLGIQPTTSQPVSESSSRSESKTPNRKKVRGRNRQADQHMKQETLWREEDEETTRAHGQRLVTQPS